MFIVTHLQHCSSISMRSGSAATTTEARQVGRHDMDHIQHEAPASIDTMPVIDGDEWRQRSNLSSTLHSAGRCDASMAPLMCPMIARGYMSRRAGAV